jgi:hypothetical protein
MAALTNAISPATDPGQRGPVPARTPRPAAADRSPAAVRPGRTVRSWPLLVLAVPAAAEVWSGWVGIAQKTGFGLVSPLPGIWPALHLDTAISLPVGVEAYAAYALRAWLASEHPVSQRTRRFAKWSAICSFTLGMAGQVASHLLAQAGITRAPWPVTTIVSCLPVLVLGMATALAHMLRADAAADRPDTGTAGPVTHRSPVQSATGRARPRLDQTTGEGPSASSGPPPQTRTVPQPDHSGRARARAPSQAEVEQACLIARRLISAGKPVSRRALRDGGMKGSNEALNTLARVINDELGNTAGTQPSQDGAAA